MASKKGKSGSNFCDGSIFKSFKNKRKNPKNKLSSKTPYFTNYHLTFTYKDIDNRIGMGEAGIDKEIGLIDDYVYFDIYKK